MYALAVRRSVDEIFSKLAKKNPKQMIIIEKKVEQILANPHHFKPLRAPMQNLRRVHVGKSFVLVYSIDEERKLVTIEDYAHHDEVYQLGR